MKATLTSPRTLKLIASHALVVALFTQPYLVALFTDLMNLVKNGFNMEAADGTSVPVLLNGLSTISGIALLIAVVATVAYILRQRKSV